MFGWQTKRIQERTPSITLPINIFQLLLEGSQGVPRPERIHNASSQRVQMLKPPQRTSLDVTQQQLCSELHSNNGALWKKPISAACVQDFIPSTPDDYR